MAKNVTAAFVLFLAGVVSGVFLARTPAALASAPSDADAASIQYLEIVTLDVDGLVETYSSSLDLEFSAPDAGLGGARTVALTGGGLLGIRAPLREDENPVVRPYRLVPDIETALEAAVRAGGQVAVPPLAIPGHGTFAIYFHGGNEHGLWEM